MSLLLVQLLSGLANAMFLFLIASGLSLIFGVTRIVNFAHGSFYMLAAYFTYSLTAALPLGPGAFYAAEQKNPDEPAERGDQQRREECRRVEGARAEGKRGRQRVREIRRQHVEGPVGEVDDARDPEDEREPRRDEEEEHRVGEAAQQLDEEEGHERRASPPPLTRRSRCPRLVPRAHLLHFVV